MLYIVDLPTYLPAYLSYRTRPFLLLPPDVRVWIYLPDVKSLVIPGSVIVAKESTTTTTCTCNYPNI